MQKRRLRRGFTLIELLIIIVIVAILAAIAIPNILKRTGTPRIEGDVGVSYQPPIVPIRITVSREGVSVTIEGHVQTPIGTFAAHTAATMPLFPERRTLTVILKRQVYVYALDNRRFSVELPNDLRGRSKLEYDGQGNITVIIPNPVVRRRSSG